MDHRLSTTGKLLSTMDHRLSTTGKLLSTMDYRLLTPASCERCGSSMECKANANAKCQCSTVQLNLNEMQYISENYEGCMCAACLRALKQEYKLSLM